jgi:hypothetical protein
MNIDQRCYGYEPAASQLKALREEVGRYQLARKAEADSSDTRGKLLAEALPLLEEAHSDARDGFHRGHLATVILRIKNELKEG